MSTIDPATLQVIAQVFGGPGVILFGLFYAWQQGPGKNIANLAEEIKKAVSVLEGHERRIMRLEIERSMAADAAQDRRWDDGEDG